MSKSRRPFVPLLPVAMVTREQDPSLLFSLNPKEGGHTSANGMSQRGLNFSLSPSLPLYVQRVERIDILVGVKFKKIHQGGFQRRRLLIFKSLLSGPGLQDFVFCLVCVSGSAGAVNNMSADELASCS